MKYQKGMKIKSGSYLTEILNILFPLINRVEYDISDIYSIENQLSNNSKHVFQKYLLRLPRNNKPSLWLLPISLFQTSSSFRILLQQNQIIGPKELENMSLLWQWPISLSNYVSCKYGQNN